MSNQRPVTGDMVPRTTTAPDLSVDLPTDPGRDRSLDATVLERVVDPERAERDHATFSSIVEDMPRQPAEGTRPGLLEGLPERYEVQSRLGEGGMGEVWRALDRQLGRSVAVKVVRAPLLRSPRGLQRFREEAQIAAQLEHPGIVPVHDLGVTPDGRLWFTMKEVRGRTLETLLVQVHKAWRMGHTSAPGQMTFRRMMDVFLRVCEAVGFAHHRGVVHRDLKPANIMVGDHGEIMVLDWGLAKVLAHDEIEFAVDDRIRGFDDRARTQMGSISGTPAYMPPEQARGQIHKIGPAADVYSLGATLYDLLTERPPYLSHTVEKLLDRVISAERIPKPSEVGRGHPIDDELDRICLKALSHAIEDRYENASELADDVSQWLDGAKKREQAVRLLNEASTHQRIAQDADRTATLLEGGVKAQLQAVPANAPEADKWAAWDLEAEAAKKRREAEDARLVMVQRAYAALSTAPDLTEGHGMLAEEYHRQHAALEGAGRRDDARAVEGLLRTHDRGRFASYLKGEGAITLHTDVEAEVELHRFERVRRRLQPVLVQSLGTTPLVDVPLAMGSYVLVLRAPGRLEVRYPVLVGREEHWDGVAPDGDRPAVIAMPKRGTLGKDDIYVPAGWFWSSAENPVMTDQLPRRRLWCDAFVMRRFPVTNAEYIAFLDALVAVGREDEALEHVPRNRGVQGQRGTPIYGRNADGRFQLQSDAEGAAWLPEMPVVMVSSQSASAFATWVGPGWRLPMDLEWEKAARGVDERIYPWGGGVDPSWARFTGSAPAQMGPISVASFPSDVSVYGVRGLAGNVSDWVCDPRPGGAEVVEGRVFVRTELLPGQERRLRGGNWNASGYFCRADLRRFMTNVHDHIGIRLVRSFSADR